MIQETGYARTDDGSITVDGLMTFKEIGRRLGISAGGAWMLYRSAMRKLERRQVQIAKLKDLVEFRARREL